MNLTDMTKKAAMNKAYEILDKNPEENIPKILNWVEKFDSKGTISGQLAVVKNVLSDKNSNWYQLVMSLFNDIDPGVRKKMFENFVINANMLAWPKAEKSREKYDCNIPWAILMDPTSACNLHCTGCWAAEYGDKLNMDFDTLDSIITQGKELGIYMYLYSGGEPLVRKKDIIALCEKHSDCMFTAFTNGTLIDEAFCDDLLRVGNFVPAISVEGFEADTDFRRGAGTYAAVQKAMKLLKEKRLPFGISCCYTSKNVDTIGSEEYFDWMIEGGAKFCWFFTYMPVGVAAVPELMATDAQREFMYHQIRKFRNTKALFTMDFWNDGEYVGGCIAGGRNYLHINAGGDIEPCAFIHYSNSNIKDTSLLDALRSPLFMAYRENQPFNKNHLRPCPLLDNPGRLSAMVHSSGAHSTDLENPENVDDLSKKCVEPAKKWAVTADKLWRDSHGASLCEGCTQNCAKK